MNKVFKIKYSVVKQEMIVVSELANNKDKTASQSNNHKQPLFFSFLPKLKPLSLFIGTILSASLLFSPSAFGRNVEMRGGKVGSYSWLGNQGASSIALNPSSASSETNGQTAEDSIAIGTEATTASATGSIAIGRRAKNEGSAVNSIAIGYGAKNESTASNSVTIARGAINRFEKSIVIGLNAYTQLDPRTTNKETRQGSVVIGENAKSAGNQSISLGQNAWSKTNSISIGAGTFAEGKSTIAMGADKISGNNYNDQLPATAWNGTGTPPTNSIWDIFSDLYMGRKNTNTDYNASDRDPNKPEAFYTYSDFKTRYVDNPSASPTYAGKLGAIALGSRTIAAGEMSTAVGSLAFALADKSTAMGLRSFVARGAEGGTAIGEESRTFAENSVAIGNKTEASNAGSMAYGYKAKAVGEGAIAIGAEVAAGAQFDSRQAGNLLLNNGAYATLKNADKSDDTKAENAITAFTRSFDNVLTNGLPLTAGNDVYLTTSAGAIKKTLATTQDGGKNAIAIGNKTFASKANSVALGSYALADAKNAFALGSYSFVEPSATNTIAIGVGSYARGASSFLGGSWTSTLSDRTVVLGHAASISSGSRDALAMGVNAFIGSDSASSLALGMGSTIAKNAKSPDSLAIGKDTRIDAKDTDNGTLYTPQVYDDNTRTFRSFNADSDYMRQAMALGFNAKVSRGAGKMETGINAMAIGAYAQATLQNSTALGVNSKTDYTWEQLEAEPWVSKGATSIPTSGKTGVISVGSKGSERRIVNVASGSFDTDAVNVAQLKTIEERFQSEIDLLQNGGGVQYLSVEKTNVNGEAGRVASQIRKGESYERYVKLKTQLLYLDAREKLNGEKFNQTSLNKIRAAVQELEAEYGGELKTTASELNKVATQLNGETTANNFEKFNQYKTRIENATNEDSTRNVGGLTPEAIAQLKADNNYLNDGAKGQDSIAFGWQAKTSGDNNGLAGKQAIAIGFQANSSAENAISIGTNSDTSMTGAVAIGKGARVTAGGKPSIALGQDSTVANSTISRTSSATINGLTFNNFAGSPETLGVLSIGTAGKERKIVNVAAGDISQTSTEAINGSQLYATNFMLSKVAQSVKNNFGGNANLATDGTITFRDIGGTGQTTIHDAINNVRTKGIYLKADQNDPNGNGQKVELGNAITLSATDQWENNGVNYKTSNLTTYNLRNGTILFGMREDPSVKQITAGTYNTTGDANNKNQLNNTLQQTTLGATGITSRVGSTNYAGFSLGADSVTFSKGGAGTVKLSGVSDATADTDAATLKQVKEYRTKLVGDNDITAADRSNGTTNGITYNLSLNKGTVSANENKVVSGQSVYNAIKDAKATVSAEANKGIKVTGTKSNDITGNTFTIGLDDATLNKINNAANQDLSNLSENGKNVITGLVDVVKKADSPITVDSSTDNNKKKTFTVGVDFTDTITEGNTTDDKKLTTAKSVEDYVTNKLANFSTDILLSDGRGGNATTQNDGTGKRSLSDGFTIKADNFDLDNVNYRGDKNIKVLYDDQNGVFKIGLAPLLLLNQGIQIDRKNVANIFGGDYGYTTSLTDQGLTFQYDLTVNGNSSSTGLPKANYGATGLSIDYSRNPNGTKFKASMDESGVHFEKGAGTQKTIADLTGEALTLASNTQKMKVDNTDGSVKLLSSANAQQAAIQLKSDKILLQGANATTTITLDGVKAATISATSEEAVNGSQLNSLLTTVLGAGTDLNAVGFTGINNASPMTYKAAIEALAGSTIALSGNTGNTTTKKITDNPTFTIKGDGTDITSNAATDAVTFTLNKATTVAQNDHKAVTSSAVYSAIESAKPTVSSKQGESILKVEGAKTGGITGDTFKLSLDQTALKNALAADFAKVDASNVAGNAEKWRQAIDVYSKSETNNAIKSSKVTLTPQNGLISATKTTTGTGNQGDTWTLAVNSTDSIDKNNATGGKLVTDKAVKDYVAQSSILRTKGNNATAGGQATGQVDLSANQILTVEGVNNGADISTNATGNNISLTLNKATSITNSDSKAATSQAVYDAIKTAKASITAATGGIITVSGTKGDNINSDNWTIGVNYTSDNQIGSNPTGKKLATDLAVKNAVDAVKTALDNKEIKYWANGDNTQKKSAKLDDGLNFKDGTNTSAEVGDAGVVKFNLKKDLSGITSIEGESGKAKLTFGDALTLNDKKLTGLADGAISTGSKDAITGGQLRALLGADVSNNTVTNLGGTGKSTISEAIKYVKDGLDKGYKFKADKDRNNGSVTTATEHQLALGSTLNIQAADAPWTDNQTTFSGENLQTSFKDQNTIFIGLKEKPTFKELTIQDTTTGAGSPQSIVFDTLGVKGTFGGNKTTGFEIGDGKILFKQAGGSTENVQLKNVADGVDDNDAVNFKQHKDLASLSNTGKKVIQDQVNVQKADSQNFISVTKEAGTDDGSTPKTYKVGLNTASKDDLDKNNDLSNKIATADATKNYVDEKVNGLSQNLSLTDGTANESLNLKAEKLAVVGKTNQTTVALTKDDTQKTKTLTVGLAEDIQGVNSITFDKSGQDPNQVTGKMSSEGLTFKKGTDTDGSTTTFAEDGLTIDSKANSAQTNLVKVSRDGFSVKDNTGESKLAPTKLSIGAENAEHVEVTKTGIALKADDTIGKSSITLSDSAITLAAATAGDAIKLTGVADGNITANSKDAVNGGQLRDVLGFDPKDKQNAAGQGIGGTGSKTIEGAISEVKESLTNATLAYKANGANDKTVKLAEGLNFTNTTNIDASVEDNGVVKFTLKENLTGLKNIATESLNASKNIIAGGTVTVGGETEGIVLTKSGSGNDRTLSLSGVGNAATDGIKVSGVKAGEAETDAVNKGQLDKLSKAINDALGTTDLAVTKDPNKTSIFDPINGTAPTTFKDAVDKLTTAVNTGWGLKVGSTNKNIGAGKTVTVAGSNGITANLSNDDSPTLTIGLTTTEFNTDNPATISAKQTGNTFATAENVASAINAATAGLSQTLKFKANGDNADQSLNLKTQTLEFNKDNNLTVSSTGTSITYGLSNNITLGDDTNAGQITIKRGAGSNPDLVIGKDGKITGLANGSIATNSTDAVNGGQIRSILGVDPNNAIGGTSKTNISEAIKEVNDKADKLAATNLQYKATNSQGTTKQNSQTPAQEQKGEVSLTTGLDFRDGKNTTSEVSDNGVVKYHLNETLDDMDTINFKAQPNQTNKAKLNADGLVIADDPNNISTGNYTALGKDGVTLVKGDSTVKLADEGFSVKNATSESKLGADKLTLGKTGENHLEITKDTISAKNGSNGKSGINFTENTVTLVGKDGNNATAKLTGLSDGAIGADSKDAINGKQIYDVLGFDPATKKNEAGKGIGGTSSKTVDGAIKEVKDSVTNATLKYTANSDTTKKDVKLSEGLNFINGDNTTASVEDNGKVKVSVNTTLNEMDTINFKAKTNDKAALSSGGLVFDDSTTAAQTNRTTFAKDGVTLEKDGSTVKVAKDGFAVKDATSQSKVESNKLSVGDVAGNAFGDHLEVSKTGISRLGGTEENLVSLTLGNKAVTLAGKDSAAVALKGVSSALGLSATTVSKDDAKTKVEELLKKNNTELNTAVNLADLQAVAQSGFDFAGNSGNEIHRTLGTKLTIKGEGTLTGDTAADNLTVVSDGTDTLTVKLSKNLTNINSIGGGNTAAGAEKAKITFEDDKLKVNDKTLTGVKSVLDDVQVMDGNTPKQNPTILEKLDTAAKDTQGGSSSVVNVKDLSDVATALTDKGLSFVGDDSQKVDRKLGETLKLIGGANKDQLSDGNNIGVTKDTTDGTLKLRLAKELSQIASIAFDTVGGVTGKISSEGTVFTKGDKNNGGETKTTFGVDGVTIDNTKTAADGTDAKTTLVKVATDGFSVTDGNSESKLGADKLTIGTPTADHLEVSKTGISRLGGADKDIVSMTLGENAVTLAGKDSAAVALKGVSSALGLSATTVSKGDAKTKVEDLLKKNNTELNTAVNLADLQAVAQSGFDFAGNSGNEIHRTLGTKLTIKGEGTLTGDTAADNLTVVSDGTDTLTVKLSKNLTNINSIGGGTATSGTGEKAKITFEDDKLKVNDKTLTGVKSALDGVQVMDGNTPKQNPTILEKLDTAAKDTQGGSSSVVNVKDLSDVATALTDKGLSFVGDDSQKVDRKLGETLKLTGGASTNLSDGANIGVTKDTADGTLKLRLAKALSQIASVAFDPTASGVTGRISSDGTVFTKGDKANGGETTTTFGIDGVTIDNTKTVDGADVKTNLVKVATDGFSVKQGENESKLSPTKLSIGKETGSHIEVTNEGIALKENTTDKSSIKLGTDAITLAGNAANQSIKLTGVANGSMAANSNDAVNGGQINKILGFDPADFDKDTDPKTGIGGTNAKTIEGAISALNNKKLKYIASDANGTQRGNNQEVDITDGLNFKDGKNTTASVDANGVVQYALNDTLEEMDTINFVQQGGTGDKAKLNANGLVFAADPNNIQTGDATVFAKDGVTLTKAATDGTVSTIKVAEDGFSVKKVDGQGSVQNESKLGADKLTIGTPTADHFEATNTGIARKNGTANISSIELGTDAITLAGANATDGITLKGVKGGEISSTSKEAINGTQLNDLGATVLGATVKDDKTGFVAPDFAAINGKKDKPTTFKAAIDQLIEGMNSGINLKGSNSTDAHKALLGSTITIKQGDYTDNGTQYKGENLSVTLDNASQTFTVAMKKDPRFDTVKVGTDGENQLVINGSEISSKVKGADGTVSDGAKVTLGKDEITLSKGTGSDPVELKGVASAIDKITKVTKDDGTENSNPTVLEKLEQAAKDGASSVVNVKDLNNVAKAVQDSLTEKGLTFADDNGTEVKRKLGETLTVKGGVQETQDPNAEKKLTDNNIGVVSDTATNALVVKLAKEISDITSIATNTAGSSKSVFDTEGVTVTGLNQDNSNGQSQPTETGAKASYGLNGVSVKDTEGNTSTTNATTTQFVDKEGKTSMQTASGVVTVDGTHTSVLKADSMTMADQNGHSQLTANELSLIDNDGNNNIQTAAGTRLTSKDGDITAVTGKGIMSISPDSTKTVSLSSEGISLNSPNGGVNVTSEGFGFTGANNQFRTDAPRILATGIDAGNKKISNVADGDISPTSGDVVTGRQLYALMQKGIRVYGDEVSPTKTQTTAPTNANPTATTAPTASSTQGGATTANTAGGVAPAGNVATGDIAPTQPTLPEMNTALVDDHLAVPLGGSLKIHGDHNVKTTISADNQVGISLQPNISIENNLVIGSNDPEKAKLAAQEGNALVITNKDDGNAAMVFNNEKNMLVLSDKEAKPRAVLDGQNGALTLVGNDDSQVTLSSKKGKDIDGNDLSRLSVTTERTNADGQLEKVETSFATMDDGLKFKADGDKVINKKLNETVEIVGDENVTTSITDDNKVKVSLNKKIAIDEVKIPNTDPDAQEGDSIVINNGGIHTGNKVITGVKASDDPTSAVNRGQLNTVIDNVQNNFNQVNQRIGDLTRESRAGIAGAMATASLQNVVLPGKTTISVGTATFKGENAVAIGMSRLSDNGKVGIRLSGMSTSNGDKGAAMSVGFTF
ncbi:YadA-like family protein [Avibacterium paragallinarum]|uniref:YadA-like family protein n=1 Tax=Avibacterium paragallinarum TaxID=728 RepID=UPI0021F6B94C|nr:YadA-like family protein [Avibacterium paragallinarum]UXN35433.1 YadA-like family protein [Avibacterium paragallinarum]